MSENWSKHKATHDLPMLQGTVRNSEAKRRSLAAIRAEESETEKYTIGEHDWDTNPASLLTILVCDDAGNVEIPEGLNEVFRGSAWIANEKKSVAICRVN